MVGAPSSVAAFEHQHHVGIDMGGATLGASNAPVQLGGVVGAHYAYGLNDQFNLMAEFSYARLATRDPDPKATAVQPAGVASGAIGLAYVLDVLRWVPYFGVLGGAHFLSGGEVAPGQTLPTAQVAFGLDYQLTPSYAVGVAVRQGIFFTKADTYPTYTTALLRGEFIWGW